MTMILGYQILSTLYESYNSLIYRARREKDGLPVVLKILKEDYPTSEELARYQQEYEITKSIHLEGVIKTYGIDRYQNTPVIILEDFGGESLKNFGKMPVLTFLPLALQITEALGQIHAANIIHKDINPSNLVFNSTTQMLKIIDFSIATRLPRENPTIKNPKQLEGTLTYISPEQTGRMNRALDYRTDLYSLGVSFYELLTGQVPFDSTDALELVHCHLAKSPPKACEVEPKIPVVLSDIIGKLMEKNVEDRYQSALGLKRDLQECFEQLKQTGQIKPFELAHKDFSGKLQLPQTLYGREIELAILLQAFERVSTQGKTDHGEMMLVSGYSGVGKSSLIHEVHKPMTEKHGYFTSGKFDQYQRNIPYFALTQAFNKFCDYLLTESPEELTQWKTNILKAVGLNGQVLIEVIPHLEFVIGPQPAIAQIAPFETQNRFNLICQKFFRVLCQQEHPFVLFIDDLQWADLASLSLIKTLVMDFDNRHFLMIGAYRDNEVHAHHPLITTLEDIQKSQVTLHRIQLHNLTHGDVNDWVAEALKDDAQEVQPLASLIYEKTQGNAFFTSEFLKSLYEQNLLSFDLTTQAWKWDLNKIAEKGITDNVIELMASKITTLPSSTQAVLKLAACIGNQFDLKTLAIISQHAHDETLADLWVAIERGLILPLDDNYKFVEKVKQNEVNCLFKFQHDRVQQAAYALIEDAHKQAVHLKIGQLLLKNISPAEQIERIFEITDHFNMGQELLSSEAQYVELAKLNLAAGKKAKQATAYPVALRYLTLGMSRMTEKNWKSDYSLAIELYKECAEVDYLSGNFEHSETLIREAVTRAKTDLEKADLLHMLIVQYTLQAQYPQAIQTGRLALKWVGIELPETDFELARDLEIAQVKKLLQGHPIARLFDLPMMSQIEQQMAVKLLITMGPPCYRSHQRLWAVIVSKVIHLWLRYGHVPQISYSHPAFGGLIGYVDNDYETAYEFGQLATRLMQEKIVDPSAHSVFYLMIGSSLRHWSKHLKYASEDYQKAYQVGLESGNLQYAAYAFGHNMYCRFYQGTLLEELSGEIKNYLAFSYARKNQWAIDLLEGGQFIIEQLSHQRSGSSLEDLEKNYLERCELHKNIQVICIYHIMRAWVLYLQGDIQKGLQHIQEADQRIIAVATQGLLPTVAHNFCYSLLLAAKEKAQENLDQLRKNQEQMKIWAKACPDNFQAMYLLIGGEVARLEGKTSQAFDCYDAAMNAAQTSHFIHYEALANELLGNLWQHQGKSDYAQLHFRKAHYLYVLWGSKCKTFNFKQDNSLSALKTTLTLTVPTHSATVTHRFDFLDVATTIKASQAMTNEIKLDKLLTKLMTILIENAGAQRGLLILLDEGKLTIQVTQEMHQEELAVLQSIPLHQLQPDHAPLCLAIANYVVSSHEPVILGNATQEGLFVNDVYIKTHKPRSILCLPMTYQGKLRGLLYLENNLNTYAFTQERLEMLHVLATQASISIENALLYRTLEQKVIERTAQLNAKVEELTKTRYELVQSEKMASLGRLVAGFAHELNTPIGVAVTTASSLQENAQRVKRLLGQEEVDIDELLSKLADIDESVQLTLSNLERAAELVNSFKRTAIDQTSDEIRVFNIKEVIEDTITTLHNRFKNTRIEIQVICPQPLSVRSFPGALEQIMTNLLVNSFIHGFQEGQQAGHISVVIEQKEEHIYIRYSDTGRGIAQEHLEKIFEPFFTTHRAHGGSGLGMYICYNLVTTQLHGSMTCESSLGQGTKFMIMFPTHAFPESSYE